uniref:Uncharacterized protein n=1 Tax=Arcella intermedia TaxID=1963864 RepID=A0A6B2LN58_9EUKA
MRMLLRTEGATARGSSSQTTGRRTKGTPAKSTTQRKTTRNETSLETTSPRTRTRGGSTALPRMTTKGKGTRKNTFPTGTEKIPIREVSLNKGIVLRRLIRGN